MHVVIKGGRCAAYHALMGVAPPTTLGALLSSSVIIYGVVTVTNNYTKIEGPAPGRSPPREQSEQRDWRRNAYAYIHSNINSIDQSI